EYHADELRIERGLAAEVGDALAGKGHKVVTWPDWTWKAGGVCTITIDHASGVLAAGADPRRMGYAIGWGGAAPRPGPATRRGTRTAGARTSSPSPTDPSRGGGGSRPRRRCARAR